MKVIAIDPGPVTSAMVEIDPIDQSILGKEIMDNWDLLKILEHPTKSDELAIEDMSPMGKTTGRTVFNTLKWIGRFQQAFVQGYEEEKCALITRVEVKLKMCDSIICNDRDIRQAVIDYYTKITPPSLLGGGKTPLVGTKKNPGPLFGVARDLWQAIAVGLAYIDIRKDVIP